MARDPVRTTSPAAGAARRARRSRRRSGRRSPDVLAAVIGGQRLATTFAYDAQNRFVELSTTRTDASVVQRYTVTLGPAGNRTAIAEHDGTVRSYGYDARDRLLSVDGMAQSWDAQGRLTAKAGPYGARCGWDFDGRLVAATLADGTLLEHDYDVDGNRVTTRVTPPGGVAVETHYLVDPAADLGHVVVETDAAGNPIARYVRADDELIAVVREGETRYYRADGIGSIRALTGEGGAATDRYAFEAFGELLAHDGADPQPYRFAGEPYDAGAGFAYHRARWMDPTSARFTSPDPVWGEADRPITLHPYLYGGGNPASNTGPTGLYVDTTGILATLQAQMTVMTTSAMALKTDTAALITARALAIHASVAIITACVTTTVMTKDECGVVVGIDEANERQEDRNRDWSERKCYEQLGPCHLPKSCAALPFTSAQGGANGPAAVELVPTRPR
ncbi:MAG: RHS repeat-associated core domain-containing protein [Candidatus Schekmanbacteria bacterium]|nr:RHS repeat-associated core domain-containing protein [Candidatus Schekmanbacteria bacterium]